MSYISKDGSEYNGYGTLQHFVLDLISAIGVFIGLIMIIAKFCLLNLIISHPHVMLRSCAWVCQVVRASASPADAACQATSPHWRVDEVKPFLLP